MDDQSGTSSGNKGGNFLPCEHCKRTFTPDALSRHERICGKLKFKRRNVFDSFKQRSKNNTSPLVDSALVNYPDDTRRARAKQRAQHEEFQRDFKRNSSKSRERSVPHGYIPCQYCKRYFNDKAAERHIAWCKEQLSRLPKTPLYTEAAVRLKARVQYRAPLPGRKIFEQNVQRQVKSAEYFKNVSYQRTHSSPCASTNVKRVGFESNSGVPLRNKSCERKNNNIKENRNPQQRDLSSSQTRPRTEPMYGKVTQQPRSTMDNKVLKRDSSLPRRSSRIEPSIQDKSQANELPRVPFSTGPLRVLDSNLCFYENTSHMLDSTRRKENPREDSSYPSTSFSCDTTNRKKGHHSSQKPSRRRSLRDVDAETYGHVLPCANELDHSYPESSENQGNSEIEAEFKEFDTKKISYRDKCINWLMMASLAEDGFDAEESYREMFSSCSVKEEDSDEQLIEEPLYPWAKEAEDPVERNVLYSRNTRTEQKDKKYYHSRKEKYMPRHEDYPEFLPHSKDEQNIRKRDSTFPSTPCLNSKTSQYFEEIPRNPTNDNALRNEDRVFANTLEASRLVSRKQALDILNSLSCQLSRLSARSHFDEDLERDLYSAAAANNDNLGEMPFPRNLDSAHYGSSFPSRLPRFCYHCGTGYPVPSAKYCYECGTQRIILHEVDSMSSSHN